LHKLSSTCDNTLHSTVDKASYKHGGFGQFEIEQEAGEYTITLIDELGEKWSNFLANWMKVGMKSAIGMVPRIDVMQNSVITKFTAS
jgi:hypothetical protein